MRAVLLPVGANWYAVDVDSVCEVVTRPQVTPVPTAGPPLIGLFNLRGEIVPFFDTGALVGLGGRPPGPWAAIVWTTAGPAGLSVSGVPESVELGEPEAIETAGGAARYALGSRLATLIDIDQILVGGRSELGGRGAPAPGRPTLG